MQNDANKLTVAIPRRSELDRLSSPIEVKRSPPTTIDIRKILAKAVERKGEYAVLQSDAL